MRNNHLRAAILFCLPFIVFWPALRGTPVWDDSTFVFDNPILHQSDALRRIWFTHESADYWPLSYSLFWLMARVFGLNYVFYHLVNLLVHIANAFLLWRIFARLKFRWAYAAALLFAIHPLTVEAVAWMFQLKTTLATFFAFLSLALILEGRYRSSLAAFVASLLSKTSAIMWPLILLEKRVRPRQIWKLVPFFSLSLVVGTLGLYWYSYSALSGSEVVRAETPLQKLLLGGWIYGFYWLKAFLPYPLIFVYPRWAPDVHDWLAYLPLAAIAGIYLALAFARRRNLLAAQLYFLFAILPVLGLVDIYYMRYSFVADHWAYLALPACIATGVGLGARLGPYGLIAAVLFYGSLTFEHSRTFASEETVWRETLKQNPDAWLAETNLASLLQRDGRDREARPLLEHVAATMPDSAEAHTNLGVYLFTHDAPARARVELETALKLFPGNSHALNSLAAIEAHDGHDELAIADLERAIENRPDYVQAYGNLAQLFLNHGRTDDARAVLNRARQIDPTNPQIVELLHAAGQ